jgi:hypothetical protein
MAQRYVQLVIGQIVTDEDLRKRFIRHPSETLATLCEQGFELTNIEIDALVLTDKTVWNATAKRLHPALQRCSLGLRSHD